MKRIIRIASLCLTALLLCAAPAFCQEGKLSPDKAIMMGYVEDFFMNNARDITMRKSLEWSDVKTDDKGNRTIRYKSEAFIWDQGKIISYSDFTVDKDGNFVGIKHVEGFPKPVEKPDVTTLEGVKKLVEKFFTQNFRDITARKTVRWGELEKHEDGSVSLVYRYEATIWNKDIILEERRFTFDKNGEVKSWNRTEGFPKPVGKLDETTSLAKLLDVEGLKPYRVDKRIADFPDKFDLSSPEAAYATQKHLLISNDEDKFEKLMKMNYNRGEISGRERRELENKIDDNWANTFKNEFVVFEVISFGKDRAFVFGLRRFDMLYDGNYFQKKEDGLWYNLGNDQAHDPKQMALGFKQQSGSSRGERQSAPR